MSATACTCIAMRDAAQLAQQFVDNRKREDLDNDRIFQFALAKALELVGESASHISDELRAQQTQIPWKKIIGMRHILPSAKRFFTPSPLGRGGWGVRAHP